MDRGKQSSLTWEYLMNESGKDTEQTQRLEIKPVPSKSCKQCYGTGIYGKYVTGPHAGKTISCDCIHKSVRKQMMAHRANSMRVNRGV